jgi:23S rRNA (uridine2552-2'-O)-methyltransferase
MVHLMARSKSSKHWLNEHFKDQYVKQAQDEGYRSRASYKLLEINKKDRLIKKNMTVIDLGAAPGGWSQVANELVGDKGLVIASDILAMDSLPGVEFIQGDFTEESVLNQILAAVDNRPIDLVISDMAPNMSGMADIDQPKAMYLVELTFDLANQVLSPGGSVITKVFQGEGADPLYADLRKQYKSVVTRKPDSSRARSREVYWVAKGYTG